MAGHGIEGKLTIMVSPPKFATPVAVAQPAIMLLAFALLVIGCGGASSSGGSTNGNGQNPFMGQWAGAQHLELNPFNLSCAGRWAGNQQFISIFGIPADAGVFDFAVAFGGQLTGSLTRSSDGGVAPVIGQVTAGNFIQLQWVFQGENVRTGTGQVAFVSNQLSPTSADHSIPVTDSVATIGKLQFSGTRAQPVSNPVDSGSLVLVISESGAISGTISRTIPAETVLVGGSIDSFGNFSLHWKFSDELQHEATGQVSLSGALLVPASGSGLTTANSAGDIGWLHFSLQ